MPHLLLDPNVKSRYSPSGRFPREASHQGLGEATSPRRATLQSLLYERSASARVPLAEELRRVWPRLSATPEDHASASQLARGPDFFILEGTSLFFHNRDVADKLLTPETASCRFWESCQRTALRGRDGCHHHAPRPAFGLGPRDVIVERGTLLLDDGIDVSWTKSMGNVAKASCAAGPSWVAMWYPFPPFWRG